MFWARDEADAETVARRELAQTPSADEVVLFDQDSEAKRTISRSDLVSARW